MAETCSYVPTGRTRCHKLIAMSRRVYCVPLLNSQDNEATGTGTERAPSWEQDAASSAPANFARLIRNCKTEEIRPHQSSGARIAHYRYRVAAGSANVEQFVENNSVT